MRLVTAFLLLGSATLFAEVRATVVNKSDVLEFVIDTHKLEDTGAWICFFSNGLDTGSQEIWAGIKGVDYKLEGGTFYRHVAGSTPAWNNLFALEPLYKNRWQVWRIPKTAFLKPDHELTWRLALFPQHQEGPLFFPAQGFATMDLDNALPCPPMSPSSLDTEYFLSFELSPTGPGSQSHLLGYIWPARLATFEEHIVPAPEWPQPLPVSSWLADPAPECIVWGSGSRLFRERMRVEMELSHHPELESRPIIFPAERELASDLRRAVVQARARAACFSSRPFFSWVESLEDIPRHAAGHLIDGDMSLQSMVSLLQALQEASPHQQWLILPESYFRDETLRDALRTICLRYRVRPLLPAGTIAADYDNRQIAELIWWRFQCEDLQRAMRPRPVYNPFPQALSISLSGIEHRRRQNFEAFLSQVHHLCTTAYRQETGREAL